MKSQDIVLLFKLISLERLNHREKMNRIEGMLDLSYSNELASKSDWQGWESESEDLQHDILSSKDNLFHERYSLRSLQTQTGISKTEISASLKRSMSVGLAIQDRNTGIPKTNIKNLLEFVVHGLKYVFPTKPAEIVRGIPTSFAAPIMKGKLMSAGEYIYVWPYAMGKEKGQAITPLYKSVPQAVKRDPLMYELLALVDAIRIGEPREKALAIDMLEKKLKI
jgi:hypothetical protein